MLGPVEYKDERSGDLRLHLFRGELDLEAFQVLERRRRRIGDFSVDAAIIGASHAVQVRFGDEVVTEVLACRTKAVDLFADRLLGVWRIEDEVSRRAAPGLSYEFASLVRPLAGMRNWLADLRETIGLADAAGGIGLTFEFPRKTERAPETLLRVWVQGGGVKIRSIHVYPGEDVAVVSDTSLSAVAVGRTRLEPAEVVAP